MPAQSIRNWSKIDSQILGYIEIVADIHCDGLHNTEDVWEFLFAAVQAQDVIVSFLFEADPTRFEPNQIPDLKVYSCLGRIYAASGTICSLAALAADAIVIRVGY